MIRLFREGILREMTWTKNKGKGCTTLKAFEGRINLGRHQFKENISCISNSNKDQCWFYLKGILHHSCTDPHRSVLGVFWAPLSHFIIIVQWSYRWQNPGKRMQIFGEALLKYDIERPAENVNISNWWYLAKAYLPCCCWRLACWLAGSDRSWWISKKNFSSLSIHGLSLESQRRRCLKHCKYWECSPATLRWRVTIDTCWDCCSQLSKFFTKGLKSRNVFVIIIVVVCVCG